MRSSDINGARAESQQMADVYVEEEGEERPRKPCEGSRKELIKCLKESECIKVVVYVLPGCNNYLICPKP